jgi:ABC-type lipoprotein release transport system permease subunit
VITLEIDVSVGSVLVADQVTRRWPPALVRCFGRLTPYSRYDPPVLPMLIFTVVIATLASVIPALSAARLRVAETLRYE